MREREREAAPHGRFPTRPPWPKMHFLVEMRSSHPTNGAKLLRGLPSITSASKRDLLEKVSQVGKLCCVICTKLEGAQKYCGCYKWKLPERDWALQEDQEEQWRRIFPESLTLKNADTFVADNAAALDLKQTSLVAPK